MQKIIFILPVFAIVIGLIRTLVNYLPIEGTAFEFKLKTVPLIAYNGVLFIVLIGWLTASYREEKTQHIYFVYWLIGWLIGAVLLYAFDALGRLKK
jgi:hypothetical protein